MSAAIKDSFFIEIHDDSIHITRQNKCYAHILNRNSCKKDQDIVVLSASIILLHWSAMLMQ